MTLTKKKVLIGSCIILFVLNLIPFSQSQTYYLSYFWRTITNQPLSAVSVTGDLNPDPVQLSEIVIGGYGIITLIDGYGEVLSNYTTSTSFSYTTLTVGNLDTDAHNEILAGSIEGKLLILDYNSSTEKLEKFWEKNYNVTQIQVADLTCDTENEVIIGDSLGNITVFDKDGNLLWTENLTESVENIKCLDFSQDNKTDNILVLTNNYVTLFNISGDQEWKEKVNFKPLDGLVGDVQGNTDLELIVKGQNMTYCFDQTGVSLWNSSIYSSESSGILLYNSSESQKFEILISRIDGAYLLNGGDGTVIRSYLSNSSVTSFAIGKIFGEPYQILVMGDRNKNLTIWTMEAVAMQYYIMNITLLGPIIDIILIDMSNDGIPDIVTLASNQTNGYVYVIGLPPMIAFTWVLIGIGIGCAVIIISLYIVIKMKSPREPKKVAYHIK
ncbi:MAG: hypothetical protein ACFFD2_30150 [Promethearchaeota archaeon]